MQNIAYENDPERERHGSARSSSRRSARLSHPAIPLRCTRCGTIELIDRVSGEVLIAMAAGRRQRFPWYQVEVEL